MFVINEDKSIYLTRGDVAFFSVAVKTETGEAYKFQPGDVVRFKVTDKKACENVHLSKDFGIEEETEEVEIYLEEKDTKIGDVISKPTDYWYEVELNPYTDPQTILGYDEEDGPKIFKLFPEGADVSEEPITPEDIPVVDAELSLTSTRPVENQAIARAITQLIAEVKTRIDVIQEVVNKGLMDAKGSRITNVADPIEDTDVVTLGFLKNFTTGVKTVSCSAEVPSDDTGIADIVINGEHLSASEAFVLYAVDTLMDGYVVFTPFIDEDGTWKLRATDKRSGNPYPGGMVMFDVTYFYK